MVTILTPENIKEIEKRYSNTNTVELAKAMGVSIHSIYRYANKLGIKKSKEYLKESGGWIKPRTIPKNAFPKGNKPWNTGTKGLTKANSGSFKKGQTPHNSLADWQEIITTDKCGKQYVKIKLPDIKRAVFKHVWVWETHHKKKVPKGLLVRFKDNNTFNITIENLVCISKKENMQLNSIHNLPAEIKENINLLKSLKNKIKKYERSNT